MTLEQHLLDTGGKGEVSFQGKRTVGEFRLSAFRLVAIRMERIRETETFGKGAQRIGSPFPIESTGFHIPEPAIGIAAPVIGTEIL